MGMGPESEHEVYLVSWMWYLAHTSSLRKLTQEDQELSASLVSIASQSQNGVGCYEASVRLLGLPVCLSPGPEGSI